ncbi:hypothetical protein BZG36_04681 [Bifiguratus adelaidae]|uniref:Protein kinase domain-containing protein n=1 Tax=Bifiguratus adelaidae TaxID=1938954 RepID=A0A261XXB2_9FUNG|nr:hypothetical protein BZG36_04681 [Bifiguratus adelaidae]
MSDHASDDVAHLATSMSDASVDDQAPPRSMLSYTEHQRLPHEHTDYSSDASYAASVATDVSTDNLSYTNSTTRSDYPRLPPHFVDHPPHTSMHRHQPSDTSIQSVQHAGLYPMYNSSHDIIDYSTQHDEEEVVDVSPNGRYAKLNTVLGKGAYKVVYKSIDREEGFEATRAEYKELSHEIEILKSVRHHNIITFHDAWYANGELVFITELMTSGTLREYIRKLQLPNLKIVKRWARQILKGLVYLHSHEPPIIHRDIKCDNIFINGAHGEVKIGDMGTAEMKLGKKYTVIGTPEFMAPEMYEERGYSEKVDIYAFGMCLLEMVTGEYPFSECKNPAQVYKKVTQGIKPECLKRVQDPEVLQLINNCLASENERPTAQEILEHTFLAVEPEVVLLAMDPTRKQLTLQVVFKGMDKLSVKFEFNVDNDTAEDVVREMIEEQVLPERYQHLITGEINRLLRDMNKDPSTDLNKEEDRMIWRREYDMRSELERAREELHMLQERAEEAERHYEICEEKASVAEARLRSFLAQIDGQEHYVPPPADYRPPTPSSASPGLYPHQAYGGPHHGQSGSSNPPSVASEPGSPPLTHTHPSSASIANQAVPGLTLDNSDAESSTLSALRRGSNAMDSFAKVADGMEAWDPQQRDHHREMMHKILEGLTNDTPIEDFVQKVGIATNRSTDKATEWVKKLQNQDIMTVGDLRDLHEEDWQGIGLTVYAARALKNALSGLERAGGGRSPMNAGEESS